MRLEAGTVFFKMQTVDNQEMVAAAETIKRWWRRRTLGSSCGHDEVAVAKDPSSSLPSSADDIKFATEAIGLSRPTYWIADDIWGHKRLWRREHGLPRRSTAITAKYAAAAASANHGTSG